MTCSSTSKDSKTAFFYFFLVLMRLIIDGETLIPSIGEFLGIFFRGLNHLPLGVTPGRS